MDTTVSRVVHVGPPRQEKPWRNSDSSGAILSKSEDLAQETNQPHQAPDTLVRLTTH